MPDENTKSSLSGPSGILGTGVTVKQALVIMAILAGGSFGGGTFGGSVAQKKVEVHGGEFHEVEELLFELTASVAVLEAQVSDLQHDFQNPSEDK